MTVITGSTAPCDIYRRSHPESINGQEVKGFDVVNPLYCYEGGRVSMKELLENGAKNPVSIDRSAIIVVRGWIPARYRDKRSRPQETN